jgi:macrolide-specific efflux system membrane fusion protein
LKSGKTWLITGAVAAAAVIGLLLFFRFGVKQKSETAYREIRPETGSIQVVVSTTATVKPQNRLEIKSPIGGRVDEILVHEGQLVKKGEVLALISSTERAALLDVATRQGKSEIDYWKNVYRETALIAPIDGQIIVRSVEPGQTVTTSDVVLVLSDRLIVKADVDETDIGRIRLGQDASIGLDAYPEVKVKGVVDHIYYESELVNNVNIYKVDVVPSDIPDVFRSGMSANVDVVVDKKDHALLLPLSAVTEEGKRTVVSIRDAATGEVKKTTVRTGLQDESYIEIVNGLNPGDIVVVSDSTFVLPKDSSGGNPFLPQRRNANKNKAG